LPAAAAERRSESRSEAFRFWLASGGVNLVLPIQQPQADVFSPVGSVSVVEPEIRNDATAQRYIASVDGSDAGFSAYLRARGRIAFMHTEVDDAFEGQGIGGKIASFALDEARAEGLEVLPICPFVRGYIERHPEYVDLVPEEERSRFGLVG
jgi:predicted GNAT family acetyltransferase